MKTWIKCLICVALACILCTGVALAVSARLSWCHVTFICAEGCEHSVWVRTGESADTSVLLEAHSEERPKLQLAGIYKDEERLINYLGEPLTAGSTTLYVGEWKKASMVDIWFITPVGTIVMYLDRDNWRNGDDYRTYMDYYLRAFAALGGENADVDGTYYYTLIVQPGGKVVTTSLYAVMKHVEFIYGGKDGDDIIYLNYKYVLVQDTEPNQTPPHIWWPD